MLNDDTIKSNLPTAKKRDFYKTELWIGQGGNGKTHENLKDEGLVNAMYIAPSYKLASNKAQEYNVKADCLKHITDGRRTKDNYKFFSVLIIDEASMIAENERKQIFENYKGKIIFCGDIGYQLRPIKGKEIDINTFDNIIEKKKNYRYIKGDKIIDLTKVLRHQIKNSFNKWIEKEPLMELLKLYDLDFVDFEQVKEQYTAKDMIITATNYRKDLFTETFKDIKKYYILQRTKGLNRGDIVEDEEIKAEKELRHGYTIHSIQGETIKTVLYIDINKGMGLRSLYTAISRAKSIKNIKIII